MGYWNSITKMGRKMWNGGKGLVSNVYKPVKNIVSTIHKASNFVDGLLDKAVDIGVPASLVDLVRNNPVYSTIHSTIDTVDDLVEKDLPRFGQVVNDFVEHNVLTPEAPKNVGDVVGRIQAGRDVYREGKQIVGNIQDIGNRAATGFTPARQPSSRGFIPAGATAS